MGYLFLEDEAAVLVLLGGEGGRFAVERQLS
jgi:hypothetical protein